MDYDFMKIFVSEEAALAFEFGLAMTLSCMVFVSIICGLVDVLFAKYKKKHDLM